jgi:hypothetical protein
VRRLVGDLSPPTTADVLHLTDRRNVSCRLGSL